MCDCNCEWHDIESAPKDRRILIYTDGIGVSIGHYQTEIAWNDTNEAAELCRGWFDTKGTELYPTHWQELPPYPKV